MVMDASAYPFIDIAVLDPVRGRFAVGEALLLLDIELETVLWANAPGAALIGADDLIAAVGMESGLGAIARRQIMGAPGYHRRGRPTQIVARISGRAINLSAERIALPDGHAGILLSAAEKLDHNQAASRAIAGFADSGQYLAIIDDEGSVRAATDGFSDLGFTPNVLSDLIFDVRGEHDRLVKRLVHTGARSFPVGFARLTDSPALHLLVTIDDGRDTALEEDQPSEHLPDQTIVSDRYSADEPSATTSPEAAEASVEQPVSPAPTRTIRFLWRTDQSGRINAISDEFVEAVGLSADRLVGKNFPDLAEEFGVDRDGAIAALLERRDTWSGRSVTWPVGNVGIPVDLAALPAYSRDRTFEGFRGFGVARFGDAQALPAELSQPMPALADPTELDPDIARIDDLPDPSQAISESVLSDTSNSVGDAGLAHDDNKTKFEAAAKQEAAPADEKVIRLSDRRERALSQAERSAFREIGDRLRAEESDKSTSFGKRHAEPPVFQATPPADDEIEVGLTVAPPSAEDASQEASSGVQDAVVSDAVVAADAVDYVDNVDADSDQAEFDAIEAGQTLADLRHLDGYDDDGDFREGDFRESNDFDAPPPADTSIVERLPVPVLIHAGDDLHYANAEFLSLTGYASVQELGQSGGLDALFVEPFDGDADNGEEHLRLRRKDGAEFPIEAVLRSVKWRAGNALMLVIRVVGNDDVGNPDETPALAEARARLAEMRTILDTATDGVVMIDKDGSIRSISRPAEALFGFDSDDLAGKPFTSLFAIESQGVAREYLNGLSEYGVASLLNDGREVIGRESQGRFIPLFMTIGKMPNNAGFCAVLRDVTQWKRAEEELSQSRRQAERASSQKTDFLARVSHEIRTPLNAIIGFSELMIDEKFGPIGNDRYRDYLRDINRSGSHVLDLVNDLLDITKIEAGEQEMSYEAVSLNDTLAEAVSIMQPQANRERVIIRSSFATRLPPIVADLRSVRQIALNILSNAVRYTQAGGQVIISTAQEPNGDIAMRVRDTGIGMSQAEIEQALKPFKQINALNRTRGDGTGLGLPLTKAMVEANRARFVITSAPNEGTLVEVVFPSTRVLT